MRPLRWPRRADALSSRPSRLTGDPESSMPTHRPDPRPHAAGHTLASVACAAAALLAATPLQAQTGPSPSRGQLLYGTHCVVCHDTQKHWRENRIVRDWDGLIGQVRQWQRTLQLQWTDADISEVARHLNDRFYRLPQPGVQQGRAPAASRARA